MLYDFISPLPITVRFSLLKPDGKRSSGYSNSLQVITVLLFSSVAIATSVMLCNWFMDRSLGCGTKNIFHFVSSSSMRCGMDVQENTSWFQTNKKHVIMPHSQLALLSFFFFAHLKILVFYTRRIEALYHNTSKVSRVLLVLLHCNDCKQYNIAS